MPLTIESLSRYLGQNASVLLADPPFKDWAFTKSFETDLEEHRVDYVFAHNGVAFVCDKDHRVRSIFLHSEELRCFTEEVADLPFTVSRQEVIARLGPPSKSGNRMVDPILGEYGAWDRFTRPRHTLHVEFHPNALGIKRITLMRPDVVP